MPEPRDATQAQVESYVEALSNHGRFGPEDQLGALNWITAAKRAAAAGGVRSGRSVSCAREIDTVPSPENPNPALHHMTGTGSEGWGGDFFGLAPHGYSTSHIDALCHIFHRGKLYNGYPAERVTAHGAEVLSIDALSEGIVSRGVLLDVPAQKGLEYLEPGTPIYPEDLEAAEAMAGVEVCEGDVLFVRTGRWACRRERGGWDPHEALSGLQAACLPWLFERRVAALGGDGVSDVTPSRVDGFRLPIHEIAIPIMGLHLLDNLELEALGRACREEGRWHFLLTVAPLVLQGGTASPVNPLALF